MRSTASTMSSIRSRHSLGGTDGLGEDSLAKLTLHRVTHHQVHAAPQHLFQALLDPEEVEKADGPLKVHEEIDVAPGTGLASRHRTEQVQRAHAEPGELRSPFGEAAK